jgi:hypothetical protein
MCRADRALYAAKRLGRNRVERADIGPAAPSRPHGQAVTPILQRLQQ